MNETTQPIPEKFHQAMQRMALRVSENGYTWRKYLATSSYLYKYESYEQLLIYGFKQDCTAVADPATWTRLGYAPRKDQPVTQIRLPGNRVLYDISDLVQTNRNDPPLQLWTQVGVEEAVTRQLDALYQTGNASMLTGIEASMMVLYSEYREINETTLAAFGLPQEVEDLFTALVYASALYTVYQRLGIDDQERIKTVTDSLDQIGQFRTAEMIVLLNHASSYCSAKLLRQIERAVQQERSRTQKPLTRAQRRKLQEQNRPIPQPINRREARKAEKQQEVSGQIGFEAIATAQIILPPEPMQWVRQTPQQEQSAPTQKPVDTPTEEKPIQPKPVAAPVEQTAEPELQEEPTPTVEVSEQQSDTTTEVEQRNGLTPPPKGWHSEDGKRFIVWPQTPDSAPYGIWDQEDRDFVEIGEEPIMCYRMEHAAFIVEGMEEQLAKMRRPVVQTVEPIQEPVMQSGQEEESSDAEPTQEQPQEAPIPAAGEVKEEESVTPPETTEPDEPDEPAESAEEIVEDWVEEYDTPKSPIPLEIFDTLLRLGSNEQNSVLRITAHHQFSQSTHSAHLNDQNFADFLKKEYRTDRPGGRGFIVDGVHYAAWYDAAGIQIAQGRRVLPEKPAGLLDNKVARYPWDFVARRIGTLLRMGQYAPQEILDGSEQYMYQSAASALWYMQRDMSDRDALDIDPDLFGPGYPDSTERIAQKLREPDFLHHAIESMEDFSQRYKKDRSLLRFTAYAPSRTAPLLNMLTNEPRQYPPAKIPAANITLYITEDEIDETLRLENRGGLEFYSGLLRGVDQRELVAILKQHYGTGGFSSGVAHAGDSFLNYDGKGLELRRDHAPEVKLRWETVVKRMREMVMNGSFFHGNPQRLMLNLERETLARQTSSLFFGTERLEKYPFPWSSDHYEAPTERIRKQLDTAEHVEAILEAMREAVSRSDLDLDRMKKYGRYISDMEDYLKGSYSLFTPTKEILDEALMNGVTLPVPVHEPLPSAPKEQEAIPTSRTEKEQETQDVVPNPVEDVENAEEAATEKPDIAAQPVERTAEATHKEELSPVMRSVVINLRDPDPVNFRIKDYDLGAGGPKAKYRANVAAIQTLQTVEMEGRHAYPEEQEILSRYVGWGGVPEAFDPNKPAWAEEYQELQELLTPEEYDAARASVLNAHYTSPTVIEAMYNGIREMGFEKGRILEPSCGVGNFFGMLPQEMKGSELHGVELDSITGRIAKQLYPKAEITVAGFETTNLPDYYDLAIGNVPFGKYTVDDPTYNHLRFTIHNYFAAKMLDQVRPGGIVAFVTSRFLMDSTSCNVRTYLAERAELLGAIRLPNTAFKRNANTEVVSDILFLQRREHPIVTKPDWIYLDCTEDGVMLNSYFVQHPEMILGTLSSESTQYGRDSFTVLPNEDKPLSEQLAEAIARLPKDIYTERTVIPKAVRDQSNEEIPADPTIPNYSYCVQDEKVYYKRTTTMLPFTGSKEAAQRITGMVQIRDLTRELIQCQVNGGSDAQVEAIQALLGSAYDQFVQKYGVLSTRNSPNKRLMREDASWSLLASLEDKDSNGQVVGKAALFTQRTVRHIAPIVNCETANDALMVCLNEGRDVNLDRIIELTGKPREAVLEELQGRIYEEPETGKFVTAEEYLSGNVREKLELARHYAKTDPRFAGHVTALEAVQPVDLRADEINVRLGSPWIDPEIIKDFIVDLLRIPWYHTQKLEVHCLTYNQEWRIEGKGYFGGVMLSDKYGTPDMNALKIIEKTLNQQEVKVMEQYQDSNGNTRSVVAHDKTVAVREKQSLIQNAFKDWIFKDPKRREMLVSLYNQRFNAFRPRTYDGSHLTFQGMSPEISLMPHQKNAVARALYGGNTLLAHVVGAGKTFEMATIAMESKRLGISHKSMIVVPNHITEQWGQEVQKLYPGAKLLVASEQDFTAANRRQFCTRIATGDWDAVIIGDSQFKMIPMSQSYQLEFYQQEVADLIEAIKSERAESDNRWSVKTLERAKRTAEARVKRLTESGRKDNVICFEELGIDRLFVDESHLYKNMGIRTKMNNVAGIGAQESSERASDMYMKCRYMDSITGGKGIVFATGTPISNSMSELYTVFRYLAHDRLERDGLLNFDAWAAQYGETVSTMELAPEGTGYRSRTRFAKFVNLPELMSMYHDFADVKLAEDLNLKVPEAIYETVVADRSPEQAMMMEELSQRATAIRCGVDPRLDNMLKVTNDGRKLGLDQRLIDPTLPDDPDSKVNQCVAKVFEIWDTTREERAAQMIFCDNSTPKPNQFNVYDDIKSKLIAAGVPEEEIAFIHDAQTKEAKQQLFTKVRQGDVRILLGSTSKMGAGTNAQDRLLALHNLDCPWVPSSLEQRAGRIIRQGNRYQKVRIFNYVTSGTFDSYLWQTVENKQRFIGQVMSGKTPVRSCEDVDETALSYAEVKALCIGNPLIKTRAELDTELTRLKLLKSSWQREQYRLSDKVSKEYPATVNALQLQISNLTVDAAQADSTKEASYETMVIRGQRYVEQKDTEAALLRAADKLILDAPRPVGEWRGFQLSVVCRGSLIENKTYVQIHGKGTYQVKLTSKGNLHKIKDMIDGMTQLLTTTKDRLQLVNEEWQAARETLNQPWVYEAEFQEKTARLIEVDAQLARDAEGGVPLEQTVIVQQEATGTGPVSFGQLLEEGKALSEAHNRGLQPRVPNRPLIE